MSAVRTTDAAAAAARLRAGRLVAFPTETVYGLGASAFSEHAVRDVFSLKGRPADNPLIVHIPDVSWLERVAVDVPPAAFELFGAFSPGPLTLVLNRHPDLPPIVSAGLATVAVRIPDHELALDLIRQAGLPLVAPSANLSGTPSPTSAAHVLHDFAGADLMVLDGGDCAIGLESTVLDLTVDPPAILRPGVVTAEQIEAKTGIRVVAGAAHAAKPKAPGQKYRHYAPRGHVVPVLGSASFQIVLDGLNAAEPGRIGVFADEATLAGLEPSGVMPFAYGPEASPEAAARSLYAALRAFDLAGIDTILVPLFDDAAAAAYNDRVRRAAAPLSRVLFVCTGNTCRSPMAAALFNHLAPPGWTAASAGLAAADGERAADHAVRAMRRRGLDLTAHRATRVSGALLKRQTLIVPLTAEHERALLELEPALREQMISLSSLTDGGRPIDDPYGGSAERYESAAAAIEAAVLRLIEGINGGMLSGT